MVILTKAMLNDKCFHPERHRNFSKTIKKAHKIPAVVFKAPTPMAPLNSSPLFPIVKFSFPPHLCRTLSIISVLFFWQGNFQTRQHILELH